MDGSAKIDFVSRYSTPATGGNGPQVRGIHMGLDQHTQGVTVCDRCLYMDCSRVVCRRQLMTYRRCHQMGHIIAECTDPVLSGGGVIRSGRGPMSCYFATKLDTGWPSALRYGRSRQSCHKGRLISRRHSLVHFRIGGNAGGRVTPFSGLEDGSRDDHEAGEEELASAVVGD